MNDKIKRMTREVEKLRKESTDFKYRLCHAYPLLPVDVMLRGEAVHFYTGACGWHMSGRMMSDNNGRHYIMLAFHEGKFDKFKPRLPKIFAGEDAPLLVGTEAAYRQLPHDILNRIRWQQYDTAVPPGVFKIELSSYFIFVHIATIYAK